MSTYVCTAVDGEDVAVAIEDVAQIAALGEVVPLPGASPPVAGLTAVHGAIVTVLSLGERPEAPTRRPRILVLGDGERGRVGLRIGSASVVDLTPDGSASPERPLTRGQVPDGNRRRWILDARAAIAAATDDPGTPPQELDVLLARRGRQDVAVPIAGVERVDRGPVIVVTHAGRRAELRCDRLLGERSIMLRPVRPGTAADGAYLGAAIDDAGRVVLVLDPARLVQTGAAGRT